MANSASAAIEQAISHLLEQVAQLENQIAALEAARDVIDGTLPRSGRKSAPKKAAKNDSGHMSPAARKRQSARMKKYWADRRKASGVSAPKAKKASKKKVAKKKIKKAVIKKAAVKKATVKKAKIKKAAVKKAAVKKVPEKKVLDPRAQQAERMKQFWAKRRKQS